jgi:hypothetical protein
MKRNDSKGQTLEAVCVCDETAMAEKSKCVAAESELPSGQFKGEEELPPGCFHWEEELPPGCFHGEEELPPGCFHGSSD